MRLVSTLALATSLAATALAASSCNGDASLCERKYSNVTYIGAHDSYSVGTTAVNNQGKDVTGQLNDGVRALQVQAHNKGGTIELCHTDCAFQDGGSLQDYLKKVVDWLSSHKDEVVTLVIVNINNLAATEYAKVFEAAGADKVAFKPQQSATDINGWPTLGSMIDNSTNLVVFMDNTADFDTVPYIIDEFTNMWEDAYNVINQDWGCAVNRSNGQPNSMMFMINHFLDESTTLFGQDIFLPDRAKLNETNAAEGNGSIGFHVSNCDQLYGRNPNIILLDYYDSNGNAPFDAAAKMNGVPAPSNTVQPATYSTTAASGGSGGGGVTTTPFNGAGALVPAMFTALAGAAVGVLLV